MEVLAFPLGCDVANAGGGAVHRECVLYEQAEFVHWPSVRARVAGVEKSVNVTSTVAKSVGTSGGLDLGRSWIARWTNQRRISLETQP